MIRIHIVLAPPERSALRKRLIKAAAARTRATTPVTVRPVARAPNASGATLTILRASTDADAEASSSRDEARNETASAARVRDPAPRRPAACPARPAPPATA